MYSAKSERPATHRRQTHAPYTTSESATRSRLNEARLLGRSGSAALEAADLALETLVVVSQL
eukprot:3116031-Prymnesium_polylepis.4